MPAMTFKSLRVKEGSVHSQQDNGRSSDFYERYRSGRKRHLRRCANEIAKEFVCPYSDCGKIYGSEGSLNLHMKIKHNAGSKTEREKYAKDLVIALTTSNGVAPIPSKPINLPITLPPGMIEKKAKQIGVDWKSIDEQKKRAFIE
jgi:hypothetical protein